MKKISILILALAGCEGTMQAAFRGGGEPVSFAFEQGLDSDSLTAVVGTETFKGRAVMSDARSTFGTGFGAVSASGSTAFGNGQFFGISSSGKFKATLLGSRGSTMRCLLQYADTSGFTASGGVGECQHSDGRMIDVVW